MRTRGSQRGVYQKGISIWSTICALSIDHCNQSYHKVRCQEPSSQEVVRMELGVAVDCSHGKTQLGTLSQVAKLDCISKKE